jgi:pimeloyl-ACP methyl ester carboxylesterase
VDHEPTYPGLPDGIRAQRVTDVNGLDVHLLTAGEPDAPRGTLLLLHGFPELSYSWRQVMVPLAAAGFHVLAPDQRGYGRTIGWDVTDLRSFSAANLVRDVVALLDRLGIESLTGVVGHDFGSLVAARAALLHPDRCRSVVLMSAPVGPVAPPGATVAAFAAIAEGLAALDPPREHYQLLFSGPDADRDLRGHPAGLAAVLRGYVHGKSGDWSGNHPHPLAGWTGEALAEMPTYYVPLAGLGMARTTEPYLADYEAGPASTWLSDEELQVYVDTFRTTGFQGGLNWYRCVTGDIGADELADHVGAPIRVPAAFVAGGRDWGVHQTPGALDRMQTAGCADFRLLRLVPGAGHWVQQERPDEVVAHLIEFYDAAGSGSAGAGPIPRK